MQRIRIPRHLPSLRNHSSLDIPLCFQGRPLPTPSHPAIAPHRRGNCGPADRVRCFPHAAGFPPDGCLVSVFTARGLSKRTHVVAGVSELPALPRRSIRPSCSVFLALLTGDRCWLLPRRKKTPQKNTTPTHLDF
uniref:Uncharacterized protein n=1 Tax=Myotis myotis TaxID=51298 RepID=A0A7J7RRX9_MYOMY|nr:hypothetical protein mMyoMyo1_010237 [Myotis myotis]